VDGLEAIPLASSARRALQATPLSSASFHPWVFPQLSAESFKHSITDGGGDGRVQYDEMDFYKIFLVYSAFPPVLLTVTYLTYLFVLQLMIRKKR
jgi:hypothetical protein